MLSWRTYRRRSTPLLFARTVLNSSNVKEIRKKTFTSTDPILEIETKKFLATLPDVVSSMTSSRKLQLPELKQWVEKLIIYNSTGGQKIRGLMTVRAYHMLEKPDNITEETLGKARVLGWCVELTTMLILDDVIDRSSTRRGQPCWCKLPDVGMRALNDSTCLLSLIFEYLKMNFREQPYYASLVNIFNEAILRLSMGQHLDYRSARNYSLFNQTNYNHIANCKTAYYTYKLPIYASLLLANRPIERVFKNTKDTLDQLGILTLMQNDFMDCFGDEAVSGKDGTDIQEGKCTWLAVTALQRFSAAQRTEFEACYGSADEACVQRVKRLYRDVDLPAHFHAAEQTAYQDIVNRLESLPANNVIPSALILKLFHMVYHLWDTRQYSSANL